jgi:hypothetical protein
MSSATVLPTKNAVFCDVRRVALVRTEVSEERIASIISTLLSVLRLIVTAKFIPSSLILVTMIMETVSFPKRRFLQKPRSVTFFIVTAVETSNLT